MNTFVRIKIDKYTINNTHIENVMKLTYKDVQTSWKFITICKFVGKFNLQKSYER